MGLVSILFTLLFCTSAPAQTPQPQPTITAFVSVNVLPMDSDRVLSGQTVLVENGKISAIGPKLAVPKNARVIDGHSSAFLSPGLADMHTHADTADDMKLYLANGVTSVLNMGEASYGFMAQVRPAINEGKKPGPHIYASFLVDGSPRYGHFTVTTPDEARSIVRLARTNGYEFIKVYNNLSPECFQALVDEGRRQHVPVVGHGVTSVGIERQLDAGQLMVAHAEEFLYTYFAHAKEGQTDFAADPARIPAAIALIQRNKAFVTADLNTYATIARQWGKPDVVDGFLRQPEVRYLSPDRRIKWKEAGYDTHKGDLGANLEFLKRFTKDMSDAGVPLITGTDAPTIPGLAPGYSLHDDLHALEDAGLTRYQALSAATRTPGELIRRSLPGAEPFGTITPGSRADLVLSAKNPLDDLSTLRKPLGVMAKGNWYAAVDLQSLLDDIARKYDQAIAPR
ncbi:amidohydrolase family protein [Dokdonella soli]|uniref:Amidohydrolase family protein n=2 Tax=Dokdonella soli TaxID=529810 RepID=A0ABN1ICI5_9GAMM